MDIQIVFEQPTLIKNKSDEHDVGEIDLHIISWILVDESVTNFFFEVIRRDRILHLFLGVHVLFHSPHFISCASSFRRETVAPINIE